MHRFILEEMATVSKKWIACFIKERKEQLLENEVLFEIIGNIFYGELRNVGDLAYDYNYAESTLRRFWLNFNLR